MALRRTFLHHTRRLPNPKIRECTRDLEAHTDGDSLDTTLRPSSSDQSSSSLAHEKYVAAQIENEKNDQIKLRTCHWLHTASLLFAEYICPAIESFAWSYSVLGLVPGLILTFVQAAFVLYTSMVTWRFCIKHPEVRDVCDISKMLFGNRRVVWWAAALMFVLNNVSIQGFHLVAGSQYLNTMTGGKSGICTVAFAAAVAGFSFFVSLIRTFKVLSKVALLSTIFTFVSIILCVVFAAIEDHPGGPMAEKYFPNGGKDITWLLLPAASTTLKMGMNAFMNISYTFIGQITLPSFIAEMETPNDFPKALICVTAVEVALFSVVGAVGYVYSGQYTMAPAFGSLGNELYLKISYSFMLPTLIFLGVLYSSVTSRFAFNHLFEGTRHLKNHTITAWLSWSGIVFVGWVLAFIVSQVIPFFTELLALMSSVFDSYFGWILWGVAYIQLERGELGCNWWRAKGARSVALAALNILIIAIGFFTLTAGTWASVSAIIEGYQLGNFGGAFSCKSNGLMTASLMKNQTHH